MKTAQNQDAVLLMFDFFCFQTFFGSQDIKKRAQTKNEGGPVLAGYKKAHFFLKFFSPQKKHLPLFVSFFLVRPFCFHLLLGLYPICGLRTHVFEMLF